MSSASPALPSSAAGRQRCDPRRKPVAVAVLRHPRHENVNAALVQLRCELCILGRIVGKAVQQNHGQRRRFSVLKQYRMRGRQDARVVERGERTGPFERFVIGTSRVARRRRDHTAALGRSSESPFLSSTKRTVDQFR